MLYENGEFERIRPHLTPLECGIIFDRIPEGAISRKVGLIWGIPAKEKDYRRLLARYGYGPLTHGEFSGVDRVLISAEQIEKRVAELGRQVSQDYAETQPVLVGVLKGVLCFISDLIRQISLPLSVEFMSISHFKEDGEGVRITKDLKTWTGVSPDATC